MTRKAAARPALPESVGGTLEDFRAGSGLEIRAWSVAGDDLVPAFPPGASAPPAPGGHRFRVALPGGSPLEVQVEGRAPAGPIAGVLRAALERATALEGQVAERDRQLAARDQQLAARDQQLAARDQQLAARDQQLAECDLQLTERREEIGLLHSISETLASILHLDEAAQHILEEGTRVLGADKGSLWVYSGDDDLLRLVASVGGGEERAWIPVEDAASITARTFRSARPVTSAVRVPSGDGRGGERVAGRGRRVSIPIRYAPASGPTRTVGVLDLIGTRGHGQSAPGDLRVLVALANQIGAALEMHRLLRENMARERVAREMELAHDLQMKLLPPVPNIPGIEAAARVFPTESVGGDFYQILQLSEGRVGVMIGDVSGHGFPAALIMALVMSAAAIYAEQGAAPAAVLGHVDRAIGDELESTEMYLSLCYCVLSPHEAAITYSNAGHPHAFVVSPRGGSRRLFATDPPMGTGGPPYGEAAVSWDPGDDLLLLFTDGLSDTLARLRRQSGEELVLATVASHAARPVAEILRQLFQMSAQAIPSIPADDRTAVILRTG